jgi:hypothetical protein
MPHPVTWRNQKPETQQTRGVSIRQRIVFEEVTHQVLGVEGIAWNSPRRRYRATRQG